MRHIIKIVFLCFLLGGKCWLSAANPPEFFFRSLTTANGLSQKTVNNIFQDSEGYMWFGTHVGLNRWDGYDFKTYMKDFREEETMSDDMITHIVEDRNKNIWVGTSLGVNKIDYQTGKIQRYYFPYKTQGSNYVSYIFVSSDNEVILSTGENNYEYDRQADTFRLFDRNTQLPKTRFYNMTEDKKGNIYMGTALGMFQCDKNFKVQRKFSDRSPDYLLVSPSRITQQFIDDKDNLWFCVNFTELYKYDQVKDTLLRVASLRNVRDIIEWDDEYILLGTFHGLVLVRKNDFKIFYVPTLLGEQGGLSHYSVLSLLKDKHQNLWVGTYAGGVNYHNNYSYKLITISPENLNGIVAKGQEDKDGNMWFATEGSGLLRYNPAKRESNLYKIYKKENRFHNRNLIKSITIENDHIYCGTHDGEVYIFSIPTKKFELLYDFKRGDINDLCVDSKKRLWIPTNSSSGLKIMRDGRLLPDIPVKKDIFSLGVISVIKEIAPDRFLFGFKENGFYYWDFNTQKGEHFSSRRFGLRDFDKLWVTSFHQDKSGNVWVSTNGAGVFVFDKEWKLFKHYTKDQGLQDEHVLSILEDNSEEKWFVTPGDLYRLEPDGESLYCFPLEDVLPLEFTPSAATINKEGYLYLPAARGVLIVKPELLRENPYAPDVLLKGISMNNQRVTPGDESGILKSRLNLVNEITLRHDQTNIVLYFTALNYLYPDQNQYAYKLVGIDDDWNYIDRREVHYSHLNPGTYIFRVKASNNIGLWNEEGKSLKITVLPPLWQRWWAYLIYIFILLVIVRNYLVYLERKRNLESQLQIEHLEREKLKELNAERNRFLTHITHEFRTPLTLILSPLDDLLFKKKKWFLPGEQEALVLIKRNAHRLLGLVRNLMDIQKQQSGNLNLELTPFDFNEFVREICADFDLLAEKRKIDLEVDSAEGVLPVLYDKTRMEQVLFNLLSNALKFTQENGKVKVNIRISYTNQLEQETLEQISLRDSCLVHKQWLQLTVEDTGIGLKQEEFKKIFEPFCQIREDMHGEISGSGIGLSLTRSIVEQHGGIIFARKGETTGLCMMVILPYAPESVILPVAKSGIVLEQEQEQENQIPSQSSDQKLSQEQAEEKPVKGPDSYKPSLHLDGKRYKILLVEDNEDVLSYLKQQLRAEYDIMTASNGRIALDMMPAELPDLVVSDIMMPEMNGVEFCRKIKEDINLCHIPVILLTARDMDTSVEEGFVAGADDYITKPFKLSLLKVRINNVLENREKMKSKYSKKFSLQGLGIKVESNDELFMSRYIELIKRNFTNADLDVDMICRELGMSRANFYKKLKVITDLSPAEMIRNIRLESAAQLLRDSRLSISEIAVQVGFSSNSYFTTCFKNVYGVSPKEFQTQLRNLPDDN